MSRIFTPGQHHETLEYRQMRKLDVGPSPRTLPSGRIVFAYLSGFLFGILFMVSFGW